jgi:2-dehydropantoate 2-reductase
VAAALSAAGIATTISHDETTLLWDKLAFLAPVALATTAFGSPLGDVRDRPEFLRCQDEVLTIARLDGALLDDEKVRDLTRAVPAAMRSSMQRDVDAGRAPELDAIAGPILRRANRFAIPVPATRALVGLIDSRIAGTSSCP